MIRFLGIWAVSFLAISVIASLFLAAIYGAALFAAWGGYVPPFPWFLWRFFIAVGFLLSILVGALAVGESK